MALLTIRPLAAVRGPGGPDLALRSSWSVLNPRMCAASRVGVDSLDATPQENCPGGWYVPPVESGPDVELDESYDLLWSGSVNQDYLETNTLGRELTSAQLLQTEVHSVY